MSTLTHPPVAAPRHWPDFSQVDFDRLADRDIIHGKALAREAGVSATPLLGEEDVEPPEPEPIVGFPVVTDRVPKHVVLLAAANVFGVTRVAIRGKRRSEPLRSYRHCITWALTHYCKATQRSIAEEINRDRSCVISGFKTINKHPDKFAPYLTRLDAEIKRIWSET